MSLATSPAMPYPTPRLLAVATVVLAAHAGVLWLLEAATPSRGLTERVIEAEILTPWVPPSPSTLPSTHPMPTPPRRESFIQPQTTPPPFPLAPVPASNPADTAGALPETRATGIEPSSPTTPLTTGMAAVPPTTPSGAVISPSSGLANGDMELPSATASFLHNPPPRYPPLSRRLGEQGQVLLRVRIEVDGTASQAEIRASSGYTRLDQAALQTVLTWRYVPGSRNGVPEAMWFNIPILFVLE